ncbi:OmpA family protein [Rhodobacteraceae bacterium F11138]|nr:OmpA family protein [Rhodobacteraceae bacterium F11138]
MRMPSILFSVLGFGVGAVLSTVAAGFAVSAVEDNSEIAIRQVLDQAGYDWSEVQADGLQVILTGTSPTEAKRFDAASRVGSVVDSARIINRIDVAATADLAAPQFSAEILRNDSGLSIIGLIPAGTDRARLVSQLTDLAAPLPVTDLLETATYPAPVGWEDAMEYAITALSKLPRSKLSISPGLVRITAISDSAKDKARLEAELNRAAPPALRMSIDISAPRPVITPFTLRFLIDGEGARFDACSADTEETRTRILDAAFRSGLSGNASCTLGMGVPSPHWGKAAEQAIAALAELGGGSVTMADADITLVAAQGTAPQVFDKTVGELETALPEVFELHAVLPADPESDADAGPPEFVATLSPEGLVQLRGRLGDETTRHVADSYARSRFGSDSVYTATRSVGNLPEDWSARVLAGIEALSLLGSGAVTVSPDHLVVRGISTREGVASEASRLLAERLGEAKTFDLDVTYRPPPPPADTPPAPEECEAGLAEIQKEQKIMFEPGSATIDESSRGVMDEIAALLDKCGDFRLEIQGHTDSQGRETMNMDLSQARAQSVLNELRARRVLTGSYSAVGYGETQPIASNKTEEGREENRRIEFLWIRPVPIPEETKTLESFTAASPEEMMKEAEAAAEDAADGEGSENEQN